RLQPDYAMAHCNLGFTLRRQGRYAESLECLRRGHELGMSQNWTSPSAQWVRDAERLVTLERRLREVLDRKDRPKDEAELSELVGFCKLSRRSGAAVRLYTDAFQADAKLGDDVDTAHRYRAAGHAVRAAVGQDPDAMEITDQERTRLRNL